MEAILDILKKPLFYILVAIFAVASIVASSVKNSKKTNPSSRSKNSSYDVKTIPTKKLKEKSEQYLGYYRYQDDAQDVVKRTKEQQKILEEYFIVPNVRTTTCKPQYRVTADVLNIIKIFAFILGVILTIIGIFGEKTWLVLGIILLIGGVTCHFVAKYFIKQFESSIKYSDAPKALMTDDEYERLVNEKIEKMNVISLGLNRLGLDASQIEEIKPIILRDKVLTKTSLRVYNDDDNTLHSSTQYVTLLYFTDTQLFVYKIQFDMCCNLQEEWTSEFFYQDICDVSTYVENNVLEIGEKTKIEYSTIAFKIIAPNSSIGFDMDGDNENVASIQAMKQKIRDKKNR